MRSSLSSLSSGLTAAALATGCGHVALESNSGGDTASCDGGEPATMTESPAGPECASLVPIVQPMSPPISVGFQPVYAGVSFAVQGDRLGLVNLYDVDVPGENPSHVVDFHLFSADGEPLLLQPLPLSSGQVGGQVTWTGQDFAVVLSTIVAEWDQDLSLQRVSAAGQKVGSTTSLVTGPLFAESPSPASNGCGLALAWDEWTNMVFPEVFFQRLGMDGAPIGTPLQITDSPRRAELGRMVWADGGYDLFWKDERLDAPGVYFARLSADGERLVENTRISDPPMDGYGFSLPRAECEGDRCGVAWIEGAFDVSEVHFVVVTKDGERVGTETVIANDTTGPGSSPVLAFVGGAFRLVWEGGEPHRWLNLRSFSREGETIDEATHLFQEDIGSSLNPAVASVANRLALTWVQTDGDLGGERRFATLGCP